MLFDWFKRRRRWRLLEDPFPAGWLEYLERNVALFRFLAAADQAKLRDDLRVFIAEKRWEGCGGLKITDEIKVTIAAQASLLTLALPEDCYYRVKVILVYPHGYLAPRVWDGATGLKFTVPRLSESWYRGPVVLSWSDVLRQGRDARLGRNLVLHEFAHQLDMLNGEVDGMPLLTDRQLACEWLEIVTAECSRLRAESRSGEYTLLDKYCATNEGEFFAVATELFFTQPAQMQRWYPQLYDLFCDYFRQDPANRKQRNYY